MPTERTQTVGQKHSTGIDRQTNRQWEQIDKQQAEGEKQWMESQLWILFGGPYKIRDPCRTQGLDAGIRC